MNQDDLFEAIGSVDEEKLASPERKHMGWKHRWIAAVACVAVIIGMVTLYKNTGSGHEIAWDRVGWIRDLTINKNRAPNYADSIPFYGGVDFQFCTEMSIEAEVIKILPDVYRLPDSVGSQYGYRILKLRVKDTIVGENMPSEIYYLMPWSLSAHLDQFDSLIMTVRQVGYENYMMINATQKRTEVFSILFFSGKYDPDMGAVLAFTNDRLDMSLWDLDGWGNYLRMFDYDLTDMDEDDVYPGQENRTIQQTKDVILKTMEEYKDESWTAAGSKVLNNTIFDWKEAREALAFVKPFKNGTFHQYQSNGMYGLEEDYLSFTRYIDGITTNETIRINAKDRSVTYSEEKFTQADMSNLPDLEGILAKEHALHAVKEDDPTSKNWFTNALYYKYGNCVFGIVYIYQGNQLLKTILVYPDGTQVDATMQNVRELIQEYPQ